VLLPNGEFLTRLLPSPVSLLVDLSYVIRFTVGQEREEQAAVGPGCDESVDNVAQTVVLSSTTRFTVGLHRSVRHLPIPGLLGGG